MKNKTLKISALSLSLLSFCMNNIIAQEPHKIPPSGTYVQQPTFSLLEGKWKATRGNEELTIVFKVQKKKDMLGGVYADLLNGWYEYKIDGQVNTSTLNFVNNFNEATIVLFSFKQLDIRENQLIMISNPDKKAGRAKCSIKLINNNSLLFSVGEIVREEQTRLIIEGQPTKPRPTEESKVTQSGTWTLTKVN